jgi:hypothetical protein
MLAILFLIVGGVMVLVLVMLALVVVGIKQEPPAKELASRAPSVIAARVRRLLGVYVRKPDRLPEFDDDRGEPCFSAGDPPRRLRGPPA